MHALQDWLTEEGPRQALLRALEAPYEVAAVRCAKIKITATSAGPRA